MTVEFELDEDEIEEFFESVEKAQGVVYYNAPYALYIETNTSYDSLKPPIQPLKEWAIRNITTDPEEAENVAYALQNKIYKQGSEGEFFLITTKAEWESKWIEVARQYEESDNLNAPELIVNEMLGGILEDSNEKIRQADKVDTGNLINSGIVLMGVNPDERNVMRMQASEAIRN